MKPLCLLPFGRLYVLPLLFLATGCGSLFGAHEEHAPALRGSVHPQAARPLPARPLPARPLPARLASGDRVKVLVSGEDDLSGEFVVDSSGFVRLPMIGSVEATGLSIEALEERIRRKLADGYLKNPQVHVTAAGHQALLRQNPIQSGY